MSWRRRGEGCYMDVMKFYRKVSLLILDEWMLIPLTKTESRDLLESVEARTNEAPLFSVPNSLPLVA